MSNIGIIAEYNPYHNGHKYLLKKAKELTNSSRSVVLMSGNFIQSGLPAMADKYTRAYAAILGGIDIVFELPILYAIGSAKDFANGAVGIFDKMNCIDYLAFGAEDSDMSIFTKIAEILSDEPVEYKEHLTNYLRRGFSYPAASEKAIINVLKNKASIHTSGISSENIARNISGIISKPNNILAICYITALYKYNSSIKPIIIKRNDNGYKSTSGTGDMISATAIRARINNGEDIDEFIPSKCREAFSEYTKKSIPDGSWLTPYLSSRIIYDRNLPPEIADLENVLDMTPELLNRLRKAPLPLKYIELQDILKTKNLTMSRVSRVLLHLILGVRYNDRNDAYHDGISEYINLLALNKKESGFINELKSNSELIVINKKSEYIPKAAYAERMWALDKLATDFYNQLIYENINIRLHSELTSSVRRI